MAQIAKIDVKLDIESSAESFFEICRNKQFLFPRICPEVYKDVKVIKGDWETVGSIKQWTYVAGTSETAKETIEAIDDTNKTIVMKVLEGDATKYYKNLRATIQITEKGNKGGSSVKWTIEYEKLNENYPAPTKYLDAASVLTKKIEAYLNNN